ncbi:hypothetical protein ABIA27_000377 [Sinorhizobium fredii]
MPVPYFHVVFTMPAEIAAIAYQNKRQLYTMLFEAAAETLKTIAADPRHLGGELGFLAILHTWGQTLTHHPHLHCLVPGGVLADAGSPVAAAVFFLPVRVLSRLFRRLFLERLLAAQAAGGLRFFGALAPLGDGNALARALRPLRKKRCRVGGGVTAPPLTDPDVQFSRIRFLMVEFSSRQQMNEQFWLAAADGVSGSR